MPVADMGPKYNLFILWRPSGPEDTPVAGFLVQRQLVEPMSHVHLREPLGTSQLMSHFLRHCDVVFRHDCPLIQRPGVNIHPDVIVFLLADSHVEDTLHGLSGVYILYHALLPQFLQTFTQLLLVVV